MDIIKKIFKDIKFKTILFSLMLFISCVLLLSGYESIGKDTYINRGFSYLYISIIYIVIYLVMFIFNRNKANYILTSIISVISLLLFIITIVKYNYNIEFCYRYLFCLLSVISFICLFKNVVNLLIYEVN